MSRMVARRVDVPLYMQIATILREQIDGDAMRIGDRLPSEPALGALYAVSRATVRQALDRLEDDGLVERVVGRGTFIRAGRAPARSSKRQRLTLAGILAALRRRSQTDLHHGRSLPPPVVAEALQLDDRAEAAFVIRIVKGEGRPWGAVKHYVGLDEASRLTRPASRGRSHTLGPSWVESIAAEPRFAMMLKVPLGAPILSVWWVDRFGRRPTICSQLLLPGADISFSPDGERRR